MKVYDKISELKNELRREKQKGLKIGFVPTMGYLHEGHLTLIREAKKDNDLVVMSIFVNPTQFGPNEDFEKYPRDYKRDKELAEKAGCDIMFTPDVAEMYPKGYQTYVEVGPVTTVLCGASRPGHFKGVTTIVSKLFHIVAPHTAYFGQKDAQQTVVLQKMVDDLNMDVQIKVVPIVREEDGLAMSSRNVYLTAEQRAQATVLNQSLQIANKLIKDGVRDANVLKNKIEETIKEKPLATIDYISIVDLTTLEEIELLSNKVLIALAVKFGATRLIDNIIVEVS